MQAIINKTNDIATPPSLPDPFYQHHIHHPFRISSTIRFLIFTFLLTPSLFTQALPASAAAPAPTVEFYLAPTGQTIQGRFLQTFQKYGLNLIGYPLTSEISEGGRTVQYFERVKMEYHPELAAKGTPVLFTRLGADISAGSAFGTVQPFAVSNLKTYFNLTGHSLVEPFLSYWRNNGGVTLFGYPISEVIRQDGMQVQWFERARMEYHPELASKGYPVQLTLFGSIAYSRAYKHPAQINNPSLLGLNSMEMNLLSGINAQRAAAGVPALSLTPALADFAHWRSTDMASRNYFAHVTPEGRGFLQLLSDRGISYSLAGEILDMNSYSDADAVKTAISNFLQSDPHRAIMLDPRYTQIGVGYANRNGTHYFTAVFIRR